MSYVWVVDDNFDSETVGSPPSNWEVSGDVSVENDPAPDHAGDLAMYLYAHDFAHARAVRVFSYCQGIVRVQLGVYIDSASSGDLAGYYPVKITLADYVEGSKDADVLVVKFRYSDQKILVEWGDGSIVVGDWSYDTWHVLTFTFIIMDTGDELVPIKRVKIALDGDDKIYGLILPNYASSTGLGKLTIYCESTGLATAATAEVYIDDVKVGYQDYAEPAEYSCAKTNLSWVDEIEPSDVMFYSWHPEYPAWAPDYEFYLDGAEIDNTRESPLAKAWLSKDPNPASGATVREIRIRYDFGEPTAIDAVALLNHNLGDYLFVLPNEPPRELWLRASNDGSHWEYWVWLLDLAVLASLYRESLGDTRAALGMTPIIVFPQGEYRYWEILVRQYAPIGDDGSQTTTSLPAFKIGRIIMGTLQELPYNYRYDWTLELEDPSPRAESMTGAVWARELGWRRVARLGFELDDEAVDNVMARWFAAWRREPHLFLLDPKEGAKLPKKAIYGVLRSNPLELKFMSLAKDYVGYELELAEEVW